MTESRPEEWRGNVPEWRPPQAPTIATLHYTDDIVPTPHGSDGDLSTDDEDFTGVNEDPSSPAWYGETHRHGTPGDGPSGFAFPQSSPIPRRKSDSSQILRNMNQSRVGMYPTKKVVAPGPHADVLPEGLYRNQATTDANHFNEKGLVAFSDEKYHLDVLPRRKQKNQNPKTKKHAFGPSGFAKTTATTKNVSPWASTARAKSVSKPNGPRGAPDRATFSQKMRDAETVEFVLGAKAGAKARLEVLTGDELTKNKKILDRHNSVQSLVSVPSLLGDSKSKKTSKHVHDYLPGRLRDCNLLANVSKPIRFASAQPLPDARNVITGHGQPATSSHEGYYLTVPDNSKSTQGSNRPREWSYQGFMRDPQRVQSIQWTTEKAAVFAIGPEEESKVIMNERDANYYEKTAVAEFANDAHSIYGDLEQRLEHRLGLELKKTRICTGTGTEDLGISPVTSPQRFVVKASP